MEIEEIKNRLDQDFDIESIEAPETVDQEEEKQDPVDIYYQQVKEDEETLATPDIKGSSAKANAALQKMLNNNRIALDAKYKQAKDRARVLRDKGDTKRAGAEVRKYMREMFLPAVEFVVNESSPTDVLNNPFVLNELDKYVLLWPATGVGNGYVENYVRTRYKDLLNDYEPESDASVKEKMRRINALMDAGNNRQALGVAKDLKERIDKGRGQASNEDYELLDKIVSYYSSRP